MKLEKIIPTETVITTEKVAEKLVQLYRKNRRCDAIDELYSDRITSIELKAGKTNKTEGKPAALRKISDWNSYVEQIFDLYISDPIVNGDYFSCTMVTEVLTKDMGRIRTNEVFIYKVQQGKIVIEQFLFNIQ